MPSAVSRKRILPHGTGSLYVKSLRPTKSACSCSLTCAGKRRRGEGGDGEASRVVLGVALRACGAPCT